MSPFYPLAVTYSSHPLYLIINLSGNLHSPFLSFALLSHKLQLQELGYSRETM